jgi:hypothetical protein
MEESPLLSKKLAGLPFTILALAIVAVSPAEAVCYQGQNCVIQQPNRVYVPQRQYVPQTQVYRPQYQPQYQQQYQPPHIAIRQAHTQIATGPAFNRSTQAWEQRHGQFAFARSGRRVWYQLNIYDGTPYVYLDDAGYVEMTDPRWPGIYSDLASGDPDRVEAAMAWILQDAQIQGLIPPDQDGGAPPEGGE